MKFRTLLPFLGLALFLYLLARIGITRLLDAVRGVHPGLLLLALGFSVLTLLLQAWKWNLLLKAQNIFLPFLLVLKIQMVSLYYGAITPGKIGSFIKIFYVQKRAKKPLGVATSSVVLERFLDLFMVSAFALVGAFFVFSYVTSSFLELVFLFLVLIAGLLIVTNRRLTRLLLEKVFLFLVPRRLKEQSRLSFEQFSESLLNLRQLFLPLVVTLLTWV